MIYSIPSFKILPLARLSASQYYSVTQCPYKQVLANSLSRKHLLPNSPSAYLGSVLHKVIELISKNVIENNEQFEFYWKLEIERKEDELKALGLSHLVPLKHFANDFALKKLQVKNLIKGKRLVHKSFTSTARKYLSEVALTNKDKTITGTADLITQDGDYISIADFKSGNIYEIQPGDEGDPITIIKREYELQLKLYAYLFYDMNGLFPRDLYIVTIANLYIEIIFTFEECERIYSDAITTLSSINKIISDGDFDKLAVCNATNCRSCSCRPACIYYSNWHKVNYAQTRDLAGILMDINVFGNGTLGVELIADDARFFVNGFSVQMRGFFAKLLGKEIKLFNLVKNSKSLNATSNNFTVIYA